MSTSLFPLPGAYGSGTRLGQIAVYPEGLLELLLIWPSLYIPDDTYDGGSNNLAKVRKGKRDVSIGMGCYFLSNYGR